MRHAALALTLAILTAGCSGRPAVIPEPSTFTVSIDILKKKCFGSAGCAVTYQARPVYNGPALDDDQEVTVTYEVIGGTDVQIDSVEMRGTRVQLGRRHAIRTSSSASTLSAKVIRVS